MFQISNLKRNKFKLKNDMEVIEDLLGCRTKEKNESDNKYPDEAKEDCRTSRRIPSADTSTCYGEQARGYEERRANGFGGQCEERVCRYS